MLATRNLMSLSYSNCPHNLSRVETEPIEGTSGETIVTEVEWLACTEPRPMLDFLWTQGKASDRKLRLFAVACCRRIWDLLDVESRSNVVLTERFADGLVAQEAMPTPWPLWSDMEDPSLAEDGGKRKAIAWARDAARMAAARATDRMGMHHPAWDAAYYAAGAVAWQRVGFARKSAEAEAWANSWNTAEAGEHKEQVILLRDIIGNPFTSVMIDVTDRAPEVFDLAETIYDHAFFDRLPELSNALEEAGCTNQDILGHCRSGGEHVRGCWVIDLVLGKE